jgi:phage terminase small subunit
MATKPKPTAKPKPGAATPRGVKAAPKKAVAPKNAAVKPKAVSMAAQMLKEAQVGSKTAAQNVAAPVVTAPRDTQGTGGGVAPESYAAVRDELVRNFGLSDREARFVMELVVDENASAAYVRAGYAAKTANINAARLIAKDSIQAATAHVRAKIAERTGYTAQEALQFVADVLRADTRELVEYKVSCCRYCYGDRHLYQRTAGEMDRDREKHDAMVERRMERNVAYEDPGFDEKGGEGFDLRKPPNTECPVCAGDGAGRVVIKDTSKLSGPAAALFAGVKEGKDGIEVKMHDKTTMVDKMFRYHGLYEADNKQSATQAADPAILAALGEAMAKSQEQYAATLENRRQNGFAGD